MGSVRVLLLGMGGRTSLDGVLALTRLLWGDYPLAVEQLRWVSSPIPRDRRVCRFCQVDGNVEDEAHVLLDCLDARLVAMRDLF
ncbi:uncharacterized protein FIBRA_04553 [Fibroporia radiculosa]|uniref:Reverse transcriptase zinc-binding domain-containing protein n=1 Tax=Fibroporia radiculosa TaxID=599839 RepID=J4H309_9APHY|nr:uncharacterized protein FIBRA_04553 [Fibroporia radiculosa]CCM02454.1 predicted protein [Fibroporia radiculosa]